jgi:sugar phosphate isomerase/epimerase
MSSDVLERLSINQITVKSWNLEETVQGCAQAGIHHVGLWLEHIDETGVERTNKLLAEHDMGVSSVCRGGFFTADTAQERAAAQANNRKAVDLTAGIGCDVLYLVCGGVPANRDLVGAREAVKDGLAELVPYARDHGVRLAIEPLNPVLCGERSVVVTLAQSLELATPYAVDDVGLAVDTFNVWWDPQALAQIAIAGDRVISYQVCDWLVPLPHPSWGRGIPGDGVIDFPPLTRAVTEAGYVGAIEVEIFNEKVWATDPAEVLEAVKDRFALVF